MTVCKTVCPVLSDRCSVLSVTLVYYGTEWPIMCWCALKKLLTQSHSPCGQMVGWMKVPLGVQVGLSPGHIVLDGDPAPSQKVARPTIFGPCLLWPNSWMNQDATWYGGRCRPRRHCVRWLLSCLPQIGAQPCACWTSKEQLFGATEECRALTWWRWRGQQV